MNNLEPIVEQFNNFSAGITSELRANLETPRFAKLWNFDVSHDRAIQHGKLRKLEDIDDGVDIGEGYYIKADGAFMSQYPNIGDAEQNFEQKTYGYFLDLDLNFYQIDTEFVGGDAALMKSISGDLHKATVPVLYHGYVYFMKDNLSLWRVSITGFDVEEVLTGASFFDNTFLKVGVDDVLYVFSGKYVHRHETVNPSSGAFLDNNSLAPYQPITNYMQRDDRNGNQGTYTGTYGPELQVIDNVDEAQSILSILGYYNGPVDGVFGKLTEDAVEDFQRDYNATGNVNQSYGASLVVDGVIGPETQSVMNLPQKGKKTDTRERYDVLILPYDITAVNNFGGLIAIATDNGSTGATVYLWDKSLDKNGVGDIGLLSSTDIGNGIVQALNVLDGRLIAIMTPLVTPNSLHKYTKLDFYEINAGFDFLPHSRAILLKSYRLLQIDNSDPKLNRSDNYVNQFTVVSGDRLYFSGRLHIQHNESGSSDEGAMSGVFSINSKGQLVPEVLEPSSDNETDINIRSFGIIGSGFIISGSGDTSITDNTSGDQDSGLITKIINGGQAWRTKNLENIFVALDDVEDLDEVRIYIREVMDKSNTDAGWVKIYDDKHSDEKRDFKNRIHLNKNTMTKQNFSDFRELQVMVIIEGVNVELVDLTVVYNLKNLNK